MPSIHIDDQTAKALESIAASHRMSVAEYLASFVSHRTTPDALDCLGDWEAQLEALSIDGPTLPSDFSRADIYSDHD